MEKPPVRVLIVDDSAFMRLTITRHLSETPGLLVVGNARDGLEALELIPKLEPDVVTLDVEMPRMDGLAALREIMANYPRPIVMLSSLTNEGARETVQALTWGAVDFIAKPESKANIHAIMAEVVEKIRRASQTRVFAIPQTSRPVIEQPALPPKKTRSIGRRDKVVVIGASTGGPRALNMLVPQLSQDLPAAVIIVQHMPVGFTRSLAERLDSLCGLTVKEAAPGDRLEAGQALVAPGGFHMILDADNRVALNQNPPVQGVRPAIDVTMSNVAQRFGAAVVGVILTGMGRDGTNGAALIRSAGGVVIAEDESTCVVWGMPRSVVEAGFASKVAPLSQIPAAIERAVRS
jgi:two-component system chemotaxis response regulator CheB